MKTRPFLLLAAAALPLAAGAKGDARWISMDAPETIDAPVLGLQRSALPLFGGLAADTSVIGDLGLLINGGLRFGAAAGPHRFVAGARYSHFVGQSVYTTVVNMLQPVVVRYDPTYTGPSAYLAYGFNTGTLTIGAEVRARFMYFLSGSATAGVSLSLNDSWSLIAEGGVRYLRGEQFFPDGLIQPKVAAGVRLAGKGFGFIVGANYAGIDDPMLGSFPIIPTADLYWSFE